MDGVKLHNRLSVRLNILIGFVIILPVAITVLLLKSSLDDAVRQATLARVQGDVDMRVERAMATLENTKGDVAIIAASVERALKKDPVLAADVAQRREERFYRSTIYREITHMLEGGLAERKAFRQLRLFNREGDEIARIRRSQHGMLITERQELKDRGDTGYFRSVIKSVSRRGEIFPLSLAKEEGRVVEPHTLTMRFGQKVRLPGGGLFGIIILSVDADHLIGLDQNDLDTGYAVTDNEGFYLRHHDKKLLYGKELGGSANLFAAVKEMRPVVEATMANATWDAMRNEFRAFHKLALDSENNFRYLIYLRRVGADGVVFPFTNVVSLGGTLFSVIAVVSFLLMLVVTNLALRPLTRLTEAIHHLGEGNLDARIDFRSESEIGRIVDAFNELAEKLSSTDKKLRLATQVFENTVEGVMVTDLSGVIEFVNPAFTTHTGYRAGEVVGKTPALLRSGRHDKDFYRRLWSQLTEAGSWQGEIWNKRKNGNIYPEWLTIVPLTDSNGAVTHYAGIFDDITERKLAEDKALLATRVFDNAIEGVLVTDANSIIQSVNPAFTKITGYSAEEVIGKKPSVLRSEKHGNDFFAAMWASLGKTGQWEGEIWNRKKNGTLYPEWITITAIKDSLGQVAQYASVFYDISETKRNQEEVKRRAYHDNLTGLPNRALFQDRLTHALQHAARRDRSLAVMFIDLDNFKNVNDSLGHAAGDALLLEVAGRLLKAVRDEDTVARVGGDEFIIILEGEEGVRGAIAVANRILDELKEPIRVKGHDFYLGASIGITYAPDDGDDAETLVKNADMAMYRAKEQGKNTFQLFTPAMNESAVKRLEIEGFLRKALERSEIVAYYQPIIDFKNGRIIGMESLMRWNRADVGMVSPVDFIPTAEESGLIVPLGKWIMQEACRQVAEWIDEGFGPLFLSVNVSGRQFDQKKLVNTVTDILEETGFPPSKLELEVTESTVMENVDLAIEVMREIADKGVRISIDDFGTGYSSLAYLKKFPIGKLKIDRSFVMDIPDDQDDCAIAKATISLGHSMGLKVIAEGVETEKQIAFLSKHECEQGQGYYFSRPLPADEFRALLVKQRDGEASLS